MLNDHKKYYIDQLEQQISLLVDSCHSYDYGKFYQAKNLSNNIRTIVKDVDNPTPKTRTKSILHHLGCKETMRFYNTGFEAKEPIININLVGIASIPSKLPRSEKLMDHIYLPLLNSSKQVDVKWLTFDDWWNSKIIVYKSESVNIQFTRKSIILTMAEQDGGTHVDSIDNVEMNYLELATATKSLFTNIDNNGIESPIINLHYALVRQIAHELIISLKKEFDFIVDYKPTNQHNLCGTSESNIKQFGVFAESGNQISIRTSNPNKQMSTSSFRTPENAAYVRFHF